MLPSTLTHLAAPYSQVAFIQYLKWYISVICIWYFDYSHTPIFIKDAAPLLLTEAYIPYYQNKLNTQILHVFFLYYM